MNTTQLTTEKKKSKSFWNRLLHLPRSKTQLSKEKQDDSFRRQSMVYSSLPSSKKEANDSNSTSEESENFTTIDSSALMDIHKHARILFLNKEPLENCLASKEDNKHVHFVPTPMNKYYSVDAKSTTCKKLNDENKENCSQARPARPILRLEKNRKSDLNSVTTENTGTQSNDENRRVCARFIDGEEIKSAITPAMIRTSTKLALVERRNMSLSQLNVSNIGKYSSLPRNQRILKESVIPMPESRETNLTESLLSAQRRSMNNFQQQETAIRYVRNSNVHRQSCYGISDPSRIFEGKKVLQSQHSTSNQDFGQRYSLGGPLEHLSKVMSNPGYLVHDNPQIGSKRLPKLFRPQKECSGRNTDQTKTVKNKAAHHLDFPSNHLSKQHYHSSTGHIPNKAINEVGLPPINNENLHDFSKGRSDTRSKSPHYIHLSEAFSNKKMTTKIKSNPQNNCLNREQKDEAYLKIQPPQKLKQRDCPYLQQQCSEVMCKCCVQCSDKGKEKSAYMSETRKQTIRSAMYTQKRRMFSKMCKYKSKLCEDGFSSMADDECSFNCSCQTCVLKLSRNHKRTGFKNFFSFNKDNKYFFNIEPNVQEGNEINRLPGNQTLIGNMASAQPHLSHRPDPEQPANKTWYNCNDSLCQSPFQGKPARVNVEVLSKELAKTPSNKLVDTIYENITDIINSATKRNFKLQDVKKIFSTPISSPIKIDGAKKSAAKNPRALFQDDFELLTLDQSLKHILTPTKNSDCFNDSIVLLQEIFQKLSQECKELLQPNVSSSTSGYQSNDTQNTPTNKYVNDLVKNLKSTELSEADFAIIIGGIAQNIFSETKAKRKIKVLKHSTSLPDFNKSLLGKTVSTSNSLKDLYNLETANPLTVCRPADCQTSDKAEAESVISGDADVDNRQLPEGWSRTPTTEDGSISTDAPSTKVTNSSDGSKDSSKYSENELLLLENAIRLGMGLSPLEKPKKVQTLSPTKATKYKSRDVLSGKGKLKLKIYNNSGLVTVFVMKATKLSWTANRELNSYVKITMIPDESKRVHWRTTVQKAKIDPIFEQKFSFEVLPEDVTKRLVFSVWHRDYSNQRSELIGCMSFSIKSILDNNHNIDGWYRLLREKFGTQKHFATHTHKNNCSLPTQQHNITKRLLC